MKKKNLPTLLFPGFWLFVRSRPQLGERQKGFPWNEDGNVDRSEPKLEDVGVSYLGN